MSNDTLVKHSSQSAGLLVAPSPSIFALGSCPPRASGKWTASEGNACLLDHISNTTDYYQKDKSLVNLYATDLIVRKFIEKPLFYIDRSCIRSNIFEFSDASRKRLLFVCRNSGQHVKSQVCLTFHRSCPLDGKSFKKTLNTFLTRLRGKFKGVKYLWVLEFQQSGQPHAHLFTDIDPVLENRVLVARLWNVATKESPENFRFTSHANNFFKWEMSSGSYLSKQYMSKESQKSVPEHYKNVGRFWGASRNMTPSYELLTEDLFNCKHLYKKSVRIVIKCYERKIQNFIESKTGKIVRVNLRRKHISRTIPHMGSWFVKLLKFFSFYGVGETGAEHIPKLNKYGLFDEDNCPSYELGVPF